MQEPGSFFISPEMVNVTNMVDVGDVSEISTLIDGCNGIGL